MPRLLVAVATADGRREVVNVGAPRNMIAFADKYRKPAPDGPDVFREIAWLTHRVIAPDVPFAEWVETLEELDAGPDNVERLRAEWELGDAPRADPPASLNGTEETATLRLETSGGTSSPP